MFNIKVFDFLNDFYDFDDKIKVIYNIYDDCCL